MFLGAILSMIEDYYKILKLSPNSGYFQVNMSYLRQINNYYSVEKDSRNLEDLSRFTRAFEVLKNEDVRKFYDILHAEMHTNTLEESNPIIQKYIRIVEDHALIGNQKAEKLLKDPEHYKKVGTSLSFSNFWMNFLFFRNPNLLFRFLFMPILCLIYVTIGIGLASMHFWAYNKELLIAGIFIAFFCSFFLFDDYRQYIINEANK